MTPDQVCADGWAIGCVVRELFLAVIRSKNITRGSYDDRFQQSKRLQQCLLFARFESHSNLYSHPLDFFPIVDGTTSSVIHIDFAPHYTGPGANLSTSTTAAPPLDAENFGLTRDRIPPPQERHEYLPELMRGRVNEADAKSKRIREELKPLHIVQPQGVSFSMQGNELEWQKWKMHVAFNGREGLVLSTVTYEDGGEVRPIMFRMSLAEMVVPYGAPEHPHTRKFAFDVCVMAPFLGASLRPPLTRVHTLE